MRKHRFTDKHPMIASILMGFFMLILHELVSVVFQVIHTMILGVPGELMRILYMIIGTFAVFLFYKLWFAPEFEGALKGGDFFEGLRLELPYIIYLIATAVSMIVDGSFELKTLSLKTLEVCLTAGFVEELSFRHGMISTMFRKYDQKEQILKVCVSSALIFGLFHLLNLTAGADLIMTLMQVLTATCIGIFFGSVYIRCGNLWPCIILHAVHDIYAITTTAEVSETGIVTGTIGLSDIVDVLACIMLTAIAVFRYLSPGNREKIVKLWDRKWKRLRTEDRRAP